MYFFPHPFICQRRFSKEKKNMKLLQAKAELLQEGILCLIHLFARDVLIIKKLEIEKTKPTFIISVLKAKYYVVLVSSISNIFTNKTSLANKLMSFSSNNSALITKQPSRFYFFLSSN